MGRRGFSLWVLIAVVFAALVATERANCQDPASDPAWLRYQHILRASTLEWLPSEGFRLKVAYQLYDLDGKPLENGTAEETWGGGIKQIEIKSPTLAMGDTIPYDVYKAHTREAYLVQQALAALARPFPAVTQYKDFANTEFSQELDGSEHSCFSLVLKGATRSPDDHTFCADADNHIAAITGPLFVLMRSDFREFRGHQIPMDLKLFYEGKLALTVHVTELDPLPADPHSAGSRPNVRVPSEAMAGHLAKKIDPSYPKEAKKKHVSGSVLITAFITKEGTIGGLDAIASPDPILTKAAEDAVQKWTYTPFILNGAPVEVDTTITVNFNMGR
jgi:TonB family protein